MQLLREIIYTGHKIHTVLTVSFEDETYAVDEDEESELFCFIITGDLAPEVNATVNVTAQPISAQGIHIFEHTNMD